jgi:hypothetical protein
MLNQLFYSGPSIDVLHEEYANDAATRVRSEESMAGPLLVLFYNSAKLRTGMEQWLTALKTVAEKR